jgi:hypothetical protein
MLLWRELERFGPGREHQVTDLSRTYVFDLGPPVARAPAAPGASDATPTLSGCLSVKPAARW